MRTRISKCLAAALLLGLFAGGALPAKAATLTWDDDADDAVVLVEPSEPSLDILKVSLSSDGSNLEWKMDMKELGSSPSASLGYNFQLDFAVGDASLVIRITEDPVNNNVRLRAANGDPQPPQVVCDKCTGEINRESKSVSVMVPITELAAISKTGFPDAAPPAAGSEMFGIEALAFRSYGAVYMLADDSLPPEGASFVL